jgi:hypothetical protein
MPAIMASPGSLLLSLQFVVSFEDFDEAVKLISAALSSFDSRELLTHALREAGHVEQEAPAPESGTARRLWVLAAAATHALSCCTLTQLDGCALVGAAAGSVYLPLLRLSATAHPALPPLSVQQRLASAICSWGCWDLAYGLVKAVVTTAVGDAGDGGGGSGQNQLVRRAAWHAALLQLPAHMRMQLAASIAEAVLGDDHGGTQPSRAAAAEPPSQQGSAQDVLALVSGEAFEAALGMLGQSDQTAAVQQALARRLLPAGLRAAERLGRLPGCLSALLDTCRWAGPSEEGGEGKCQCVVLQPSLEGIRNLPRIAVHLRATPSALPISGRAVASPAHCLSGHVGSSRCKGRSIGV